MWTVLLALCPSTESPLTHWSTSTPSTPPSLNLCILALHSTGSGLVPQCLCVDEAESPPVTVEQTVQSLHVCLCLSLPFYQLTFSTLVSDSCKRVPLPLKMEALIITGQKPWWLWLSCWWRTRPNITKLKVSEPPASLRTKTHSLFMFNLTGCLWAAHR